MSLNLIHLRTLVAFVRHGTLSAAATELGYSAGALSLHLDSLARAVGRQLVQRTGRIIVLTDAGRALASHAENVLAAEAAAIRAVEESGSEPTGMLTIGTWGSSAAGLLAPVISHFAASTPGVVIRSVEIDVDDTTQAVRDGAVDAAFGLDYSDRPSVSTNGASHRTHILALHRERFGVAVPRTGMHARDQSVWLESLAAAEWILPAAETEYGRAFRNLCRSAGFEPDVVHVVTDTAASLRLVDAGLGVTPVTDLMLKLSPSVAINRIELRDPAAARSLVLVLPPSLNERLTLHRFREAVLAAVALEVQPTAAIEYGIKRR